MKTVTFLEDFRRLYNHAPIHIKILIWIEALMSPAVLAILVWSQYH